MQSRKFSQKNEMERDLLGQPLGKNTIQGLMERIPEPLHSESRPEVFTTRPRLSLEAKEVGETTERHTWGGKKS